MLRVEQVWVLLVPEGQSASLYQIKYRSDSARTLKSANCDRGHSIFSEHYLEEVPIKYSIRQDLNVSAPVRPLFTSLYFLTPSQFANGLPRSASRTRPISSSKHFLPVLYHVSATLFHVFKAIPNCLFFQIKSGVFLIYFTF